MASCMPFSLTCGLFRALVFVVVAMSMTCKAQDPSIVGGTEVPPGVYPFFVQGQGCGASLILPDVVLTAAHCVAVPGKTPAFKIGGSVFVGNTERDTVTFGAQEREIISAMQVHPLWDGYTSNGYDFALFQIENVTMPGLVPVRLNFDSCYPSGGELATVMGFGLTSGPPGQASNKLLEVDLTYFSNADCQAAIRAAPVPGYSSAVISETMVCGGYQVGEPVGAQCQGDSGGPYIDADGVQVGVVSWSLKPCGAYPGVPGVAARVSAGIDWIKETACELTATNSKFCKKSKKGLGSKRCKKGKKGTKN